MFFVVAPEDNSKGNRRNEQRPSKGSCNSTNAFSKRVSAQSKHRRPDNSPGGIEGEKSQRGQAICSSEHRRERAQQSNETSEKDDLPTVASKQILSQLPLPFVETDQLSWLGCADSGTFLIELLESSRDTFSIWHPILLEQDSTVQG
jgi:hypothetical protein